MHDIFHFILDSIFPTRCVICGSDGSLVCPECRSKLTFTALTCPFCYSLTGGATCEHCRKKRALDGAISVFDYDNPRVQKIISALKFEDLFSVVQNLAMEMLDRAFDIPTANLKPLICPAPQRKASFIKRGYNQSDALARLIVKSGIGHYGNPLREAGKTTQHFKSASDRWQNLETRIAMRLANAQPHAIVVDDILTTGATLEASARALKSRGAKTVWGFTLARQQKHF